MTYNIPKFSFRSDFCDRSSGVTLFLYKYDVILNNFFHIEIQYIF